MQRVSLLIKWLRARVAAVLLTGIGLILTVYLAFRSGSPRPPTVAEATWLAVLAGVFQVMGVVFASQKGRADPGHACSAVRRLLVIGVRARIAEVDAQKAFENGGASARQKTLGSLSTTLSFIQQEAKDAVEDWKYVHPDAVRELLAKQGSDSDGRELMGVSNA